MWGAEEETQKQRKGKSKVEHLGIFWRSAAVCVQMRRARLGFYCVVRVCRQNELYTHTPLMRRSACRTLPPHTTSKTIPHGTYSCIRTLQHATLFGTVDSLSRKCARAANVALLASATAGPLADVEAVRVVFCLAMVC